MKKYLSALSIIAFGVCLMSCSQNPDLSQNSDLSEYSIAHSNVYAKYEDTVNIAFDTEFDLKNIVFYDSESSENVVPLLVPGDTLNIYYSDNGVEKVFVDKASLIEIEIRLAIAPGGNEVEVFIDAGAENANSNIVVDSSRIKYVINDDDTFVTISEYYDKSSTSIAAAYATYNPENNKQTTELTTLIQLEAIYSFKPR